MAFISVLLLLAAAHAHGQGTPARSPKLILQITVDQLRGDMPASVYDRFGPGGFRYLYENGVVYENAHHRHANTETVVGHATLATGADPADHGMIGNIWFDRELGRAVYNIEDDRYTLTGEGGGVDKDVEVDPTQKVAGTDGRSPAALLTTTFSDELALSTNGKAKIFGVSVKDRGAVTMAGHAGKAFWFSKAKGGFVTSTYYYDAYPAWVDAWNRSGFPQAYAGTNWDLLHDRSTYTFGDYDDMPWETNLPGFGVVFPHPFGAADSRMRSRITCPSVFPPRITWAMFSVPQVWKAKTICCASTRPCRSCSHLLISRWGSGRPSSFSPPITARPRCRTG